MNNTVEELLLEPAHRAISMLRASLVGRGRAAGIAHRGYAGTIWTNEAVTVRSLDRHSPRDCEE
jgi:hypothetical protein